MPASETAPYTVRPATREEREAAAKSWRTMLTLPREGKDGRSWSAKLDAVSMEGRRTDRDGRPWTQRVTIGRGWLTKAIMDHVDATLADSDVTVLVAEHPEALGFALGWVAFTGSEVLALYVTPTARGRWVGRTLLQAALGGTCPLPRFAVMTPAGQRLLDHVKNSAKEVAA